MQIVKSISLFEEPNADANKNLEPPKEEPPQEESKDEQELNILTK